MTDEMADRTVIEPDAPPRRLAAGLAALSGIVLLAFVAVLATADGDSGIPRSPLLEKPAPPIEGVALDGSTFDLDAIRGRWVVVNFFQTTCVPCVEEHPELVAFHDAHRVDGDAVVVSVAFSDSQANVREFFERNGGDWPVLAADTGRYAISYGVAAVPETFLVAPSGIVTSKFIGGVTQDRLEAEINRLGGSA